MRNIVDIELAGLTREEVGMLDAACREAQRHLEAMVADLDRVNRKIDRRLAQIERLRARQLKRS